MTEIFGAFVAGGFVAETIRMIVGALIKKQDDTKKEKKQAISTLIASVEALVPVMRMNAVKYYLSKEGGPRRAEYQTLVVQLNEFRCQWQSVSNELKQNGELSLDDNVRVALRRALTLDLDPDKEITSKQVNEFMGRVYNASLDILAYLCRRRIALT